MRSLIWLMLFSAAVAQAEETDSSGSTLLNQLGGAEDAIRDQLGTQEMGETAAVQGRFFPKQYRHELNLKVGTVISGEPYLNVQETGFSYRFYLLERLALGATYSRRFRQLNSNYEQLKEQQNISAEVYPPTQYYGGEVVLTPVYAKIDLFGLIGRLDIYTELGYHRYQTTQTTHHSMYVGGGIRIMPARWWTVSFGLSDHVFNENRRSGEKLRNVLSFNGSVSLWLPFGGST